MINLFYAPCSTLRTPCSLVSHITLEDTAVRVDFAKSEQRQPEYLAINPRDGVRRVSAMRACAYARVRVTRSYVLAVRRCHC
jgi:hypothetical protein